MIPCNPIKEESSVKKLLSVILILSLLLSFASCKKRPVQLTVDNWSQYIGVDFDWVMSDESFIIAGMYVDSYEYELTNHFYLIQGGYLNNVSISVEQHFNGTYTVTGPGKCTMTGWFNPEIKMTYQDSDPDNDGKIAYRITLPTTGEKDYVISDLGHYYRNDIGGSSMDTNGNLRSDQQIVVVSITGEFVPN